jgi:hypothetical protein
MYLLLVTWFFYNQVPQSYQATFGSEQACQAARQQILTDARRLNADRDAQVQRNPNYNPIPAPTVSAVCARR